MPKSSRTPAFAAAAGLVFAASGATPTAHTDRNHRPDWESAFPEFAPRFGAITGGYGGYG